MINIPEININIPDELYNSLKHELEEVNEEMKADINEIMSFEDFLIFILKSYIE